MAAGAWVYQDITHTSGLLISSLTFWAYAASAGKTVTIHIMYDDASEDDHEFALTAATWIECDATSYIDTSKIVHRIKFTSNATSMIQVAMDDISCLATDAVVGDIGVYLTGGVLGGTTLYLHQDDDFRAVGGLSSSQKITPAVSDFLNSAPDIQTGIWSKNKEEVTYIVRQTNAEFYALLQLLILAGTTYLYDATVNDALFYEVYLVKVDASYNKDVDNAHPWEIGLVFKKTYATIGL
jgi:hypothetical protein